MKILRKIKAQAGKVRANATELYTLALIAVGIPAIFYLQHGAEAAFAVMVLIHVGLGLLSLKVNK